MKLTNLALLALLLFSDGLLADERKLVIVHTNDFHGHIQEEAEYAGAARIAAFVDKVRSENESVLVLDAGDAISGTPVSTMFKGAPIFEVLNHVGYDAGAIGNHEFDHGFERINKFREVANYPLLSANAFAPHGDLISDSPMLIREINGIRVAIIGLITETTPFLVVPTGNDGIMFAPPMYSVDAVVRAVRPHVDLVIALTHIGVEEDQELARSVDGIDLIVGGHSHTLIDPPIRTNDTFIVQANYYGTHVGYVNLTIDTEKDRISTFQGKLVPAAKFPPPKPEVKALVEEWEAKVAELVDVEIAIATREYTKEDLQPRLEKMLALASGAERAFYNLRGIRDVIRKGPVTARQLWKIEPFGNNLVTMTTTGATLKQIFSNLDREPPPPMVKELEDNEVYTIATNSYIAGQAKKAYPDDVSVSDKGILIRDVLIDYIRENGIPK
jgi:2',3'-cyclic-nucleotide 2'-phosphodiesterase (5'-nucleotidase family)